MARNDPYPMFTTLDPHHFLNLRNKLILKGYEVEREKSEMFRVAFSPFGQNADWGKNMQKEPIPIGDLNGRWSMIPLLFGDVPAGQTVSPALAEARNVLFPTIPAGVAINNTNAIDPNQELGFFTIPIKYKKHGLRFDISAQIIGDFGINIHTGVTDICQTVTGIIDLTCQAKKPCNVDWTDGSSYKDSLPELTKANVQQYLMHPLETIATEIDLNIENFHKVSIEDICLSLYWRHSYEVNEDREGWPLFLATPFCILEGTIATAKEKKPYKVFSLSHGNNGHDALGFTTGIDLDFFDTIEIGAEAGFNHFFSRNICDLPVPTSTYQSGIYPFKTNVRYSPGHNWHFAAKMQAYHFIDRLSMYFQYILIHHEQDKIQLKNYAPAFKPEKLEKISSWKAQVANVGFNYDISPYISLGFLWQAPISQRNTYRSSSIMVALNITY